MNSSKLLPTVLAFALVTASQAAIVVTPTGATSTTTIGAPRDITAAISGLGLDNDATEPDLLSKTHDGGGSNTHWLSAASVVSNGVSATEVLTFDLGGTFDINTIYLWTYNRPERARGIRTFDISFSTDGGSNFGSAVSAASLGMADFDIGTTGSGDRSTAQTRTFSTLTGVTDIRFTNIANFGGADRLALPEIRFGAIPEPSSVVLLLGGIGALVVRRRRH